MGKTTYEIEFTRYKNHMRRDSRGWFINAASFSDAHNLANHILTGFQNADTDAEFEIVAIRCNSYHGEKCSTGSWETEAEFTARCEADQSDGK